MLALIAAPLALAVACSSKPAPNVASRRTEPASRPKSTVSVASDDGFITMTRPDGTVEKLPADVQEINRKGSLKDSFVDFDRYESRPDQRDRLAADAEWLRRWPTVKVRIEGNCDERGTAGYNMALGEKRAAEAKEYLTTLGIDRSRIEIVSYGKEKPFVDGHDESAWSQNRRDHVLVTATE